MILKGHAICFLQQASNTGKVSLTFSPSSELFFAPHRSNPVNLRERKFLKEAYRLQTWYTQPVKKRM